MVLGKRPVEIRSPDSFVSHKHLRPSPAQDNKAYKGLRHFSLVVCKKVQSKGTTTYNEVADELVQDAARNNGDYDEKNIRRRVYDALNVLMAMDIITKDRKDISWKGLPVTQTTPDAASLQEEITYLKEQIRRKRDSIKEMIVQQTCFRNLKQRNQEIEDSKEGSEDERKIPLPFIVVNTDSTAVIDCNMSKDLSDVMFNFSMPFAINDDNILLKKLNMYVFARSIMFWPCSHHNFRHGTSLDDLKKWLTPEVLEYCQRNDLLKEVLTET